MVIAKLSNHKRMESLRLHNLKQDIETVIKEAINKYEAGKLKHGELNLLTDKRDFIKEAIEEMLDTINYLAFQIIKLRKLKNY